MGVDYSATRKLTWLSDLQTVIDDVKISSEDYPSHVRQVGIVLAKAEEIEAEFKMEKCSIEFAKCRIKSRSSYIFFNGSNIKH